MPIQSIDWIDAQHREIHVVAGNFSSEIARTHLAFLKITAAGTTSVRAASYLADTTNWSDPTNANTVDVSLQFTPVFKGTFGTGANAHIYSGLGIDVNTKTGRVTVGTTLPAKRKNNFIMEIKAFNKSSPTIVFSKYLRFHIHQSITKIWLTPSILSVRPFTTENKFAIRAQFDDNTVGDITQMPGVTWNPSSNSDTFTGKLSIAAGNNAGDLIDITARLPNNAGSLQATAKIRIEEPWSAAHPVQISIVPGGGSPTTAKRVNILFISEGFIVGDNTEFTKIVNGLLTFINDPINLPWSKLLPAINLWSVFVPATDRGFSIGSEIFTAQKTSGTATTIIADFIPVALRPAPAAGIWKIEELIYMVGLPVQSDASTANGVIKQDWKNVFLANDPTPHVNDALINDWKKLSTRSMIDEINSTFGVIAGTPAPDASARIMEFKNGRMTRDTLDHFLESLNNAVPGGIAVNKLWAKPAGSTTLPPDYDLICFLTYGHGRESNQIGYYFVNTTAGFPNVKAIAGTNAFGFDLVPPNATFITPNKSRTFIHELAHSFFIEDEYPETLGPSFATSAKVNENSNIMLEADVLTGGQIDAEKIKWNWDRIRKAAVLSAAIQNIGSPANNEFKLTVTNGQGTAFKKGDTVHLRFRKYPTPLNAFPKLSAPLDVIDPAPTADIINVKVKTGGTFTYPNLILPADYISTFLPDSIVYAPVDAPASVKTATYPYAEMVAKNIKDYITTNHVALTGQPPATPKIDLSNPQVPVFNPAITFPATFNSVNKPRIVGLYAGGKAVQLGIFHATGNCVMRKSQDPPQPDPLGREFCAVCRYILVDTINPGVHGDIDALYSPSYPIT